MSRRSSSRRRVSIFKGIALLVSMPQPICLGHTILVRDRNQFREWIGSVMSGMKKVELPGMESLYSAFSSQPDEASQLLTQDLLGRVTRLAQAWESKGVSLAFYQSNMFVLIGSGKDFFEPPDIRTSAAHEGVVLAIWREIESVLGLIDYIAAPAPAKAEPWQGN